MEDNQLYQIVKKDNSGDEIYLTNEKGERLLDEHNHLITKRDLKEIADAFETWAKQQNLCFWR